MNGEGFETLVKEGQEVTAEEALIRFDIDLVKKHGYSPEILVIFTELPEGKTIKTEEKHIAELMDALVGARSLLTKLVAWKV